MSGRKLLEVVASEVTVCTKCDLWKNRKNAVPGVGSIRSNVFFIGEAPGQSEDAKGEPFVGAAGEFLNTLLSEIGFSREDVFITNVVKCRPPRNRQPLPIEIATCTPYLERQVSIIKPRVIVTLGNHSTAYILSKAGLSFDGISQVHGKMFETSVLGINLIVFPTFHPAAALYSGEYRKRLIDDFRLLKGELVKRKIAMKLRA
ncbi:MAG TPA: type-4 uracil-DNA glycosylase [Candidatus Acidoferrum sp.]|jgi:DNA polymerase|nr:type-4 uracil-DNA glycosylase [Candidatus Acidoferrum sp.]